MLKSYRVVVGWWPIRFYCQPQSQSTLLFWECFGFMNGTRSLGTGIGLGLDNKKRKFIDEP